MNSAGGEFLPWYRRNPEIFEQEKEVLVARGFRLDEEHLRKYEIVQFRGRLDCAGDRDIVIAYSDAFPSWPPSAWDEADGPVLSRHQRLSNRHFCLFGVERIRWSANKGAADVISEIETLFAEFGPEKKSLSPDVVPEPITASLSYTPDLCALVPPGVSAFAGDHGSGSIILRYGRGGNHEAPAQAIVLTLNIAGSIWNCSPAYKGLALQQPNMATGGAIVFAGQPTLDDLKRAAAGYFKAHPAHKRNQEQWLALLFPEQSESAEGSRVAWVLIRCRNGQQQAVRTYVYRPGDRWVRAKGMNMLSTKKILMIGCGCLGSKIAVNFAATGATNFGLLDCDLHEPDNSVRHELGISSFGQPKARALLKRMQEVNPEIEAEIFAYHIGGAQQPFETDRKVLERFAESDIVINTTGNHGVSRWMDECCFRFGVPGVFVSVTNGAWGGEIVRVIPGKTACWLCWKEAYESSPPPGEPSPAIFGPGCDQPSFTGTSYECGIVADAACCMIAETLLGSTVAKIEGDYIRWTNRNADRYEFRSEKLKVPHGTACQLCKAA
jgi:molybdopterin/thiamine biosynthesis adenylyltransferase